MWHTHIYDDDYDDDDYNTQHHIPTSKTPRQRTKKNGVAFKSGRWEVAFTVLDR
jgi:hypothetical protein